MSRSPHASTTSRTAAPRALPGPAGTAALAALDLVAVVVFATIGRRSHAEGVSVVGVLGTAAPFLLGALVAVLATRSWRDPLSWRTAAVVWVGTVVIGLGLRALLTGSLPLSFAIVATIALGVLVLGWRVVARVVLAVRARRRA